MRFARRSVETLPLPTAGERFEWDEELSGSAFAAFSERYLNQHAEVRKKPSSVRNDRLMLRRFKRRGLLRVREETL